jgi:hypothetical protein
MVDFASVVNAIIGALLAAAGKPLTAIVDSTRCKAISGD